MSLTGLSSAPLEWVASNRLCDEGSEALERFRWMELCGVSDQPGWFGSRELLCAERGSVVRRKRFMGSSLGLWLEEVAKSGERARGWFPCMVDGLSKERPDDLEQDKGIRWMPWHQEAMKDVARCEKPRGAASRR